MSAWIGANAVTELEVSASSLRGRVPASVQGRFDVRVETAAGELVQVDAYRYLEPLQVSSLSPSSGPIAGGTQVTVSGAGFEEGVSLWLGGVPIDAVSVDSPNRLSFVTPALLSCASSRGRSSSADRTRSSTRLTWS